MDDLARFSRSYVFLKYCQGTIAAWLCKWFDYREGGIRLPEQQLCHAPGWGPDRGCPDIAYCFTLKAGRERMCTLTG